MANQVVYFGSDDMRIEKIHIKGFRNFDDEEILFQPKTLIIGANDVG